MKKLLSLIVLFLSILLNRENSFGSAPVFVDVTDTALPNLSERQFAGGAAIGDCNGDGLIDLYLTGLPGAMFLNLGDGTFTEVTTRANLGERLITSGAAFADVDNDGDLDLFVSGSLEPRHFLFINDGTCRFSEQALERGVAVLDDSFSPRVGRGVSFGDYDRDGYLDLFIAEFWSPLFNPDTTRPTGRLLRNRGKVAPGFFEDVTLSSGLALDSVEGTQDGTFLFAARFTDFDRDGWPDLAISADFSESRLYWNEAGRGFRDGTDAAGVGTDKHGMGITTADFDGDGRLDLFVTAIYASESPRATGNRLWRYAGNRTFVDITDAAGVRNGMWGWGAEALDYDNDGDLDLVQANGMYDEGDPFHLPELGAINFEQFATDPIRLWRNDGNGSFSETSEELGLFDHGISQGVVPFDFDGDGDLDILVTPPFGLPLLLFRNDTANANNWFQLDLLARSGNRFGIGAVVTVHATGAPSQVREVSASSTYLTQNGSGRLHFGLGAAMGIKRVVIEWPDGTVQLVQEPPVNALTRVTVLTDADAVSCSSGGMASCPGDCNGDATLSAHELGIGIGRIFGNKKSDQCPLGAFDRDRDGIIGASDLIGAVLTFFGQPANGERDSGKRTRDTPRA